MTFKSWIKSWVMPEQIPSDKDEKTIVMEALIMELEDQIRNRQYELEEEEEADKNTTGSVDYRWLVTRPKSSKRYQLPQMERLELEELSSKVRSTECTSVISLFREGLLRKPDIQDIPRIFRTIIRQIIETRPKEETMADKVKKNLSKVRPAMRVTPVSFDDSFNMTPVTRLGEVPTKKSSASSTEFSSFDTADEMSFFQKSLDDLPV